MKDFANRNIISVAGALWAAGFFAVVGAPFLLSFSLAVAWAASALSDLVGVSGSLASNFEVFSGFCAMAGGVLYSVAELTSTYVIAVAQPERFVRPSSAFSADPKSGAASGYAPFSSGPDVNVDGTPMVGMVDARGRAYGDTSAPHDYGTNSMDFGPSHNIDGTPMLPGGLDMNGHAFGNTHNPFE